jgi:acyl-CoA synthetase (NDP forming)
MTTTDYSVPAPASTRGSHRLNKLFAPTSVALVGASDRSAWSIHIHNALGVYGFPGSVFYVNPRGGTAHGHTLVTSLAELPVVPDLVFVMVPASAVIGVLEEAAVLGVPAAEILSSGFAEIGPAGAALQDQVKALADRTGMAILGPNNLGFTNVHAKVGLNPTQDTTPLRAGPVAMISQSGNLAGQIQTLARSFDVGLSLIVSTGNEVDVTAAEVIDYLADDPNTQAIGVFLETIRHPDEFRAGAERARANGKLVIVLKAGRSEAAARSAMAHTGALVGDDKVIEAALTASGVIRVDTLEDLLATADVYTRVGAVAGRNLGVISISGGAGDIASDLAEPAGLQLPDIAADTHAELTALLPDYGTAQNPLDMTGLVVGVPDLFGDGLAIFERDPNFDMVIAITEAEHYAQSLEDGMLPALLRAADASSVPTLLVTTTVHSISPETLNLRGQRKMPAVSWGLERVISALSRLADWSEYPTSEGVIPPPEVDAADLGARVGVWSEARSRALLKRNGVPAVPSVIVSTGEGAVAAVAGLNGPFALKVVSDEIPHKSDVGGVRLGIAADDLTSEVDQLLSVIASNAPTATIDGVMISPMRVGGVELLVGVVRDPEWGCVLAIAMGGIWTEVLQDVQRVALPASADTIRTAILSLRSAPLLTGARGATPVDLDRLTEVVDSIARTAQGLGTNLAALEVNPLRVDGSTIEALDAMVVWND